ncbi:MCE family protein [Candidatus Methylocalor cossyra]|uniref:MCE family protein n=2 Tax=Candidatus Methylocalor cossyra TaxID=3108543 RepID=A0ABM9NET4_9GAMM
MAIGGFLLAGLALLVGALLAFGGGELFRPKLYWVVFFDSSLNGLNVGAPVKVQGVQVGTVKEIVLQADLKKNRLIKPVVLEISPGSLVDPTGKAIEPAASEADRRTKLQRLIDSGLRARLEIQSLLTGLLFVDLDFYPHYKAELSGLSYKDYPEVPAIPTTVDEVKSAVDEALRKFKDMPIDALVQDVSVTFAEIRTLLASDETKRSREALLKTLVEAERLLTELNRQLPVLVQEVRTTAHHADRMTTTANGMVRELRAETKPTLAAAQHSLQTAAALLEEAKRAMANITDTTAGDSTLQESLSQLRDAARSVRDLSDYLQRRPEALIFGR